ncbi:MAG: hypothetical protein CML50_24140 [Rhodobacteraceae bacterium]|nr:hypothetical protein [Paracoccaceae bacterium]|tara:strand:+ start:107 stop:316 length:210 start_codon:yes stop_codon:yes gene_type:complete
MLIEPGGQAASQEQRRSARACLLPCHAHRNFADVFMTIQSRAALEVLFRIREAAAACALLMKVRCGPEV